jgi:hypothetical protein
MTSYFSVQIPDLQEKYTGKDYWDAFAIIVCISFMFLFFFSRFLMWVTETLDGWLKTISKAFVSLLFRKRAKHVADPYTN